MDKFIDNEIVIIDYNMGNIGSVVNMIKKSGGYPIVSSDENIILSSKKLLLPGVGSFDAGMNNLKNLGLDSVIKMAVLSNIPILGICLGMQLLLSNSEEGELDGLNLVQGSSHKFKSMNREYKIPHMGWNNLNILKNDNILNSLDLDSRFYFVHSYFVKCMNSNDVLTTTNYITDFVSMYKNGNIYGAQFHPEKSHKYGMQLFKNFINL